MFLSTCAAAVAAVAACDGVDESGEPAAEEAVLAADEESDPRVADLIGKDVEGAAPRPLDELSAPDHDSPRAWSDKVLKGGYRRLQYEKVPGFHYQLCVWPTSGDPGLFGHYAGKPTKDWFQFASQSGGLSKECIEFTATQPGTYYFAIYGYTESKYIAEMKIS